MAQEWFVIWGWTIWLAAFLIFNAVMAYRCREELMWAFRRYIRREKQG